jgi:hypothetical protein
MVISGFAFNWKIQCPHQFLTGAKWQSLDGLILLQLSFIYYWFSDLLKPASANEFSTPAQNSISLLFYEFAKPLRKNYVCI